MNISYIFNPKALYNLEHLDLNTSLFITIYDFSLKSFDVIFLTHIINIDIIASVGTSYIERHQESNKLWVHVFALSLDRVSSMSKTTCSLMLRVVVILFDIALHAKRLLKWISKLRHNRINVKDTERSVWAIDFILPSSMLNRWTFVTITQCRKLNILEYGQII